MSTMDAVPALLMLADARLPAGGHAHSGGVEAAIGAGLIDDLASLELFLRGRLRTAGAVAATLAAAAAEAAAAQGDQRRETAGNRAVDRRGSPGGSSGGLRELDAEADARMPSPAQRAASRQQGRALLRAARTAWSSVHFGQLASTPGGPHHPIVLGVAAAAAGATPRGAAYVAAYLAVSGPASAAVRLRGFDPLAVNALLAGLAPEIDTVAALDGLAAASTPRLDLLAEVHARSEVRLFAS